MTGQYLLQAVVALLAVTNPVGAACAFGVLTDEMTVSERRHAAIRATLVVYIVLAVCAVGGAWLLRALGIELSAFRAAGGLVIAIMGLEMLLGATTRMQADPSLTQTPTASDGGDALLVPFAIPMVAGPGAVATVLAMTARGGGMGHVVVALLAVAVVAIVLLVALLAAPRLDRLGTTGYGTYLRLMGLLLVAVGVQLLLDGATRFALGG